MAGQPGLFDLDERYVALSAAGDPLERLGSVVDFELFNRSFLTSSAISQREMAARQIARDNCRIRQMGS